MRSAVDTNVLLDVFRRSPVFFESSRSTLLRAISEGSLVACEVVWAETSAHFPSRSEFERQLENLGVEFDPCDADASVAAGAAWRRYRREGGSRTVLLPDFLVAAHAQVRADRLVTRDRGFARRYFPKLEVLDPTAR